MSLITSPATSAAATAFLGPLRPPPSFHSLRHGFSTTLSSSSSSARPVVLTMKAKREDELEAIRAMTTEEINQSVIDLKGELIILNFTKHSRQEFKPSEFGRIHKRIARMLTVKREREIEEGIKRRLSRKLDRKWKKSIVIRPPPGGKKLEDFFPELQEVPE